MSDALTTEKNDVTKPDLGTVEFLGEKYVIGRKPNPLLLSELARTATGGPEAMGVIAEFFENTLADYAAFKRAVYTAEEPVDETILMGVLQEILEVTMGRPTE